MCRQQEQTSLLSCLMIGLLVKRKMEINYNLKLYDSCHTACVPYLILCFKMFTHIKYYHYFPTDPWIFTSLYYYSMSIHVLGPKMFHIVHDKHCTLDWTLSLCTHHIWLIVTLTQIHMWFFCLPVPRNCNEVW